MPRSTLQDRERELIRGPNFCHIATRDDDDTIHSVIAWCDLDDRDRIVLNTVDGRRWLRNAQRMGGATLTVPDTANPYEYVSVVARLDEATSDGAEAVIDALARKFTGEGFTLRPNETRVTVRFAPERISYRDWT
jgi:PPOX class probable F420-dependent enzyme